ncbi:hypothetical protein SAMN05444746_104274 [Variovorax sp. OK212]|nr:hypothetical protein SAMN05518853_104274 [Variovorax sp. OK202]SFD05841.1 hypothetical protein SAMN05444746_104274 [Variovorax sp. OK212]
MSGVSGVSGMSFDDLSRRTGIEIPPLLAQLLAGGPPALASFSDFEWIDAAEAAGTVDEWLDAKWQDGRRFLPFAQSGAGDAYCLMPLDGTGTGTGGGDTVGVAFVWHDAEESRIEHASFSDFVCAKFLQTFADMSWLEESDLSEEEMAERVVADVAAVSAFMDAGTAAWLQALSRLPIEQRPYKAGPRARPEPVPSLIPQDRMDEELLRFERPHAEAFPVKPRWEIGE